MALLCPVGMMAPHQHCRLPAEYCREAVSAFADAVDRGDDDSAPVEEETRTPLLAAGSPRAGAWMGEEHARVVTQAQDLIQQKVQVLRCRQGDLSRKETSNVLRDICGKLGQLATKLEDRWLEANPGKPIPSWPLTSIPEDELARIGWDFHANRVQIVNTGGSVWETVFLLLSGDQQASYAQPPTAGAVVSALSRAAARLREELRSSEVDGAL